MQYSAKVDSPIPASPPLQDTSPPMPNSVTDALKFAELDDSETEHGPQEYADEAESLEEEAGLSNSASENEIACALSGNMEDDSQDLVGLSPGSKKMLKMQFAELRVNQDGLHFVRFGILLGGRGPAWVLHC